MLAAKHPQARITRRVVRNRLSPPSLAHARRQMLQYFVVFGI
jgi:hypothetical protein